jgi:uncharacterized protein YgiB involved in biofilm formation
MRTVVILFIAAVAGFMACRTYIGECPGGAVVQTEAQCRAESGLSPDICSKVFERALSAARNAGSVYTEPGQCRILFGECLDHASIVGGYVPRPHGFCVKASGGALASMVPVYRQAAAR